MLFMNKKEEVLDVQLTQYGKYLLSKGKLRPSYYSFFDDNIIYDLEYSGIVENQNEVNDRIISETPQMQTHYKFTGKFEKTIETDYGNGDIITPTIPSERNSLNSPLGNSRASGNKNPAISIKMLNGTTDSYDLAYTTEFGKKNIPQINATIEYQINIKKFDISLGEGFPMDNVGEVITESDINEQYITSDPDRFGNYLLIKNNYILADILEENTDFKMENFIIEVFEKNINPETSQEELTPLSFAKKQKKQSIVNNILLDKINDEDDDLEINLEVTDVEYYFDIFCDNNIDKELIMRATSEIKSRGFYTETGFSTDQTPNVIKAVSDIYGTNVDNSDIEDCE